MGDERGRRGGGWGWRGRGALVAIGMLPWLVFAEAALLRVTFHTHDLQFYFLPYHALPARLMALGHAPLWNPYVFCGIPLLGDGQTALFYPPNWLFLLLPAAAALNYVVLAQFMIAGLSLYLYARHLSLGNLPSLIGAIAFMFGGCLTARVVHLSNLSGAALVPLLFLAVDHALRSQRPRAFVLAAAAVALHAVCGHPQTPVYTAVGLGLYALVTAGERRSRDGRWHWFLTMPLQLAAVYALAYGLAAIQLAPWIEFGRLSPRSAGASFDFIMNGSMQGSQWLWFVFPYLFGVLRPGLFADQPLSLVDSVTLWEHTAYVGILPLALAGIGLLGPAPSAAPMDSRRRWFATLTFTLLLALGLIIAAGQHTPFGALLYATPVLGKLREVERALILAAFALTMLAALGFQRIMDDRANERPAPRARRLLMPVAALTAFLPALCVAVAQHPGLAAVFRLSPATVLALAPDRPRVWVPLLLALISGALLAAYARRAPPVRWLHPAAVAVVLIDMVLFAAWFNPVTTFAYHAREPDVLATLRADPAPYRKATFLPPQELDTRTAQETLAISWGMLHGIEDINGFNSLQPRRYTDYLFGTNVADVSYGYLADENLLRADNPILSSLNVKYLLVPHVTAPALGAHFRLRATNAYVAVYENLHVYPRAWFVNAVHAEADPHAILRTVTARGFDGRREAWVEAAAVPPELTPEFGVPPRESPPPPPVDAPAILTRDPNHLAIQTQTREPRLLVMSEMYFPGWRAAVDGRPVRMYRTNYLFRGVVVPAGTHRITFDYRPGSVRVGAGLSILSLALAMAICLWERRRTVSARQAPAR